MTVFEKNWLRTSFWKQLLGKYTSLEQDPDPDLAVKIPDPNLAVKMPDPGSRSGKKVDPTGSRIRIPNTD